MTWSPRELSRYVDDDLSSDRRRCVEQHLASCPECAAVISAYRRLASAIRHGRVMPSYQPFRYAHTRVPAGGSRPLPTVIGRAGIMMASLVAMILLALGVSLLADRGGQSRTARSITHWPANGGVTVDVALEGQNAVAQISPRGAISVHPLQGSPWALASGVGGMVAGTTGPSEAALEFPDLSHTRIPLPLTSIGAVAVLDDIAVATGLATEGAPATTPGTRQNRAAVVGVDLRSRQMLWQRVDFALPPPALAWLPGERVAVVDPSGAVILLNGRTGATVSTVPIEGPVDPLASCLAIVPYPGGYQRLALVNVSIFTVDIIDAASFRVVDRWHLAPRQGPAGWLRTTTAQASSYSQTACAVSPDGKHLYMASSRSPFGDALVSVDTTTGLLERRLPAPEGGFGGMAVTPDGRWIYVSAIEQGQLLAIDATTLAERGSLTIGSRPRAVVLQREP